MSNNTFEITGKLVSRGAVQQVTDKFKKLEFVLEVVDGQYSQFVKMQLTQNNCDKISGYKKDDELTATFNLRGRGYEKEGKTVYYSPNLDCWKLEKAQQQQTTTGVIEGANGDDLPF